MLTVICPNCRHRFPAPGCCDPEPPAAQTTHLRPTCYYGGLLLPRNYTSGGGCFINAPTLLQTSVAASPPSPSPCDLFVPQNGPPEALQVPRGFHRGHTEPTMAQRLCEDGETDTQGPERHITTSRDLTGGSVTITTPGIQSGGCLIQTSDRGVLLQAPHVEIRPKLTGGGCLIEKRPATEAEEAAMEDAEHRDCFGGKESHGTLLLAPSGCQELPGTRRNTYDQEEADKEVRKNREARTGRLEEPEVLSSLRITGVPLPRTEGPPTDCQGTYDPEKRNSGCCCASAGRNAYRNRVSGASTAQCGDSGGQEAPSGLQIQVNATVQLPASLGHCTVNITASAGAPQAPPARNVSRNRNNLNGGGLVRESAQDGGQLCENVEGAERNGEEERNRSPTTPVSWLMPCPWGFDAYLLDRDVQRLSEVRRSLQACGWYHEGLSWQQSESLLKNKSAGRWLMRDSSDSRYTFAVSVQTARGPTSVRVHYLLGRFRLDAQPRLAFAMPLFDCPIKMLEYYVEYSKTVDRKEVWVDYSGQVYSEIYLTRPLVKEIRSLSHLARLVVNRCKLSTENLPPLIRSYLEEYPYTL